MAEMGFSSQSLQCEICQIYILSSFDLFMVHLCHSVVSLHLFAYIGFCIMHFSEVISSVVSSSSILLQPFDTKYAEFHGRVWMCLPLQLCFHSTTSQPSN